MCRRVEENLVAEVPRLSGVPRLQELSLSDNAVEELRGGEDALRLGGLARLELRGGALRRVGTGAARGLEGLRVLVLSGARRLHYLPELAGAPELDTLRADRCSLRALPPGLCRHAPRLRTLYVQTVSPSTT